jgi:D-glycero-D-manno-heptose 1,7-bisphosphate phosphatase
MNASDLLTSASLPGTEPPRRALFLGRSGSLLPVTKTSLPKLEPEFFSGPAAGALFRAAQAGWIVYLVGNAEPVAEATVAETAWERFESELLSGLAAHGIPVRHHYACLDHPQGKGKHRRDSVFLFPNTGALYHAAQEDGIDLSQSWVVAHRTCELAAGWRAGCRTARVGRSAEGAEGDLAVEPHIDAASLSQALALILSADKFARR